MVVAFLFSWLPYACVCLLIVAGDPTNISPLAAAIPAYIAKASVIWNPPIYVGSNKMFRFYFYEFYVAVVKDQSQDQIAGGAGENNAIDPPQHESATPAHNPSTVEHANISTPL